MKNVTRYVLLIGLMIGSQNFGADQTPKKQTWKEWAQKQWEKHKTKLAIGAGVAALGTAAYLNRGRLFRNAPSEGKTTEGKTVSEWGLTDEDDLNGIRRAVQHKDLIETGHEGWENLNTENLDRINKTGLITREDIKTFRDSRKERLNQINAEILDSKPSEWQHTLRPKWRTEVSRTIDRLDSILETPEEREREKERSTLISNQESLQEQNLYNLTQQKRERKLERDRLTREQQKKNRLNLEAYKTGKAAEQKLHEKSAGHRWSSAGPNLGKYKGTQYNFEEKANVPYYGEVTPKNETLWQGIKRGVRYKKGQAKEWLGKKRESLNRMGESLRESARDTIESTGSATEPLTDAWERGRWNRQHQDSGVKDDIRKLLYKNDKNALERSRLRSSMNKRNEFYGRPNPYSNVTEFSNVHDE